MHMTEDVNRDAARLLDTLQAGGIALFPVDVGYAIVGNHEAAIERIFRAKQRSYDKPCGMFSNWQMVQELALLDAREMEMVDTVIHRYGLPLSIVTPYRTDAAFFSGLTPIARLRSSRAGTIDMLLNAGALHDAVARESVARGVPVLGSSANQSLSGSKYRLQDVEPAVREAADLVIDYGPTKYSHPGGMGSTIIELPGGRALRRGIKFDEICAILSEHFGIDPRALD
jgi:tRNA A37 threonylcarbamoyladenosine synthetase subunit TsaC/SUA5/YrdC